MANLSDDTIATRLARALLALKFKIKDKQLTPTVYNCLKLKVDYLPNVDGFYLVSDTFGEIDYTYLKNETKFNTINWNNMRILVFGAMGKTGVFIREKMVKTGLVIRDITCLPSGPFVPGSNVPPKQLHDLITMLPVYSMHGECKGNTEQESNATLKVTPGHSFPKCHLGKCDEPHMDKQETSALPCLSTDSLPHEEVECLQEEVLYVKTDQESDKVGSKSFPTSSPGHGQGLTKEPPQNPNTDCDNNHVEFKPQNGIEPEQFDENPDIYHDRKRCGSTSFTPNKLYHMDSSEESNGNGNPNSAMCEFDWGLGRNKMNYFFFVDFVYENAKLKGLLKKTSMVARLSTIDKLSITDEINYIAKRERFDINKLNINKEMVYRDYAFNKQRTLLGLLPCALSPETSLDEIIETYVRCHGEELLGEAMKADIDWLLLKIHPDKISPVMKEYFEILGRNPNDTCEILGKLRVWVKTHKF